MASRLTEKDEQGNWRLKDVAWEEIMPGAAITQEVYEKLYGALFKLKDYEDTGLSPDEVERISVVPGKWIPVSERLPNEEDFIKSYCRNKYCAEFIVMIKGATRPTTLYFKNGVWADDNNNHYKVIAWKPLPEPYKEESENDEM